MAETKGVEKVRHEIYGYLEQKGVALTQEDKKFIGGKIREHSDNRLGNLTEISKRYNFVTQKVSEYLTKAKSFPKTPAIAIQIEALELFKRWLNENAE